MGRYVVGITGASGSIYGLRLLEELLKAGHYVHLVFTKNGQKVLEFEVEETMAVIMDRLNAFPGELVIHDNDDMFSSIASGSFKTDGMMIAPCSMGTLAKISSGITDTLLVRAADVMIKEKRRLLLVTRESPLNSIHLENMLKLSRMGVDIVPPVPAFYDKPKNLEEMVNFSVGRILASLDIENNLYTQWTSGADHE